LANIFNQFPHYLCQLLCEEKQINCYRKAFYFGKEYEVRESSLLDVPTPASLMREAFEAQVEMAFDWDGEYVEEGETE